METGNVGSATGVEHEDGVVMHGDADGHDATRCLRADRRQLAPIDRKHGYIVASRVDCQQPAAILAQRDGTLRTQSRAGPEAAGQDRLRLHQGAIGGTTVYDHGIGTGRILHGVDGSGSGEAGDARVAALMSAKVAAIERKDIVLISCCSSLRGREKLRWMKKFGSLRKIPGRELLPSINMRKCFYAHDGGFA